MTEETQQAPKRAASDDVNIGEEIIDSMLHVLRNPYNDARDRIDAAVFLAYATGILRQS